MDDHGARQPWPRAEELFLAALELDPRERADWLARECGDDAGVRELVDALLAGHATAEPGFLEAPGLRALAGRRVGEFTLVRLLGEGGMGAVYEAWQAHPRRKVALKLVRALPGSSARVEREAELLARLSHAHIAQIHAAGTIADELGQLSWFAMELVEDARTLLDFARELDLANKLALFEHLCRAVQHGHQRGVVHLDLKPSNVLVDAAGALKVIDFGVARALSADPAAATLSLRTGELAGTLAYLAPERAGGDTLPDTRADVYALGVILCELVTGRRPIALEGKSLTDALSALRDVEPTRPRALAPEIALDLEAIVLHAIARDPERRYASVDALAADLHRYQRGEPTIARPPSAFEQVRSFTRRHRALVGALAIAFVSLAAATIISTGFAVRARRARDAEATARTHAERIAALQRRIFTSARPTAALGRDVTVREVLDDARFALERELADEPAALAEMLATLGATYAEIGAFEAADELLRKSLELGSEDELALASRRSQLAYVLIQRGRHEEAGALLAQALTTLEGSPTEFVGERVAAFERQAELLIATSRLAEAEQTLERAQELARASGSEVELATVLAKLGDLRYGRRDFAGAEALHRQALELALNLYPGAHPRIAGTRNALASDLFDLGRIDEAETLWTQALETFERVLDPTHADLAAVVGNLALVYGRRRDFERAEAMFERALELRRAALGPAHPRVATTLAHYSAMLLAKGDLERAEAGAREAIEIRRGAGEGDAGLASDLVGLAIVLRQRQRAAEAVPLLEEALRLQRATLEREHPDLAQTLTLLGSIRLDLGDASSAEPLLREALAIRRAKLPGNWLTANTASVLGGCLLALERLEEAESLLAGALPAIEQALGPRDFRASDARERLARLYERTARAELALALRQREN